MSKRFLLIAVLLAALLPTSAALAWGGEDHSICKRSADTLANACRFDVRDNYYVTVAYCQNLAGRHERRACFRNASETKTEDGRFCGEVREARVEACDVLGEDRYDTDPLLANDFIHPDQVPGEYDRNPYISIIAGHTYVLRAGEAGEEIVVVHVTDDTREILGVDCRVIVDIVVEETLDEGEVEYEAVEVTDDWFAQTVSGDVVYCGEVARNFEDGVLRDLDGSFEAGLDYAKSGYLTLNTPVWGLAHRQEFSLEEAEDIIQYVGLNSAPSEEEGGNVPNPNFSCGTDLCLRTFDFAPIHPESTEFKYYLPGVGFVLAVGMEDGELTGEREELVCLGDSLDVLSEPECGLADSEALLEKLCRLSPEAFCE
jgi:hypothetical protein